MCPRKSQLAWNHHAINMGSNLKCEPSKFFLPFLPLMYLVTCHDPERPFLPQSGSLVFCVFFISVKQLESQNMEEVGQGEEKFVLR